MDLEPCRRAMGNPFSLFASGVLHFSLALDRVRPCWSLRSCMGVATNVLRSCTCMHACAGTAQHAARIWSWQTGFAFALGFRVSWVSGPSAGDLQRPVLARPLLRWLKEIGLSWLTCRYSIGITLLPVRHLRRKNRKAMGAMSNTRSPATSTRKTKTRRPPASASV